ncbi:Low-affinity inorganic phosphate transporter 1 [Serratia fonticola]|uniref:Low-affinity inorganic phosphate transporter 1 n=1 Tax=Serratia fonticola TaxID=47917 RepID=A0A4U9TNN6_SERFO|nr:Low-affinity inorganic phosphate transporter 1 [Serratia fonticola]
MTYAQGVSAQMTAALSIGVASYTGMPVSTTQVLSSAVAGTMLVDGGWRAEQNHQEHLVGLGSDPASFDFAFRWPVLAGAESNLTIARYKNGGQNGRHFFCLAIAGLIPDCQRHQADHH